MLKLGDRSIVLMLGTGWQHQDFWQQSLSLIKVVIRGLIFRYLTINPKMSYNNRNLVQYLKHDRVSSRI